MIARGQVRAIRELGGPLGQRVQAEVCLGASTKRGSAIIKVEYRSPKVLAALAALKEVLAEEALEQTRSILKDQLDWDRERAARASADGAA